MQAVSGLHGMTGTASQEPAGLGFSYSDHAAGYFGALAILAALPGPRRDGRTGAMIDLGQVEASVALTSAALLDYQVNGRPFAGWGNVPFGAPRRPGRPVPVRGRGQLVRHLGPDRRPVGGARGASWAATTSAATSASRRPAGRPAHRPLLDRGRVGVDGGPAPGRGRRGAGGRRACRARRC